MAKINVNELTEIEKETMEKRVRFIKYSMYGSGFLAYALYNWVKSAGGMILPGMIDDYHWTSAQSALFVSIFTYFYAVANFPCGMLVDIWGPRKMMGLCYSLITIGSLLFAFSDNYVLILIGRALTAIGGAAIFSGISKCISAWEIKQDVPGMIGYVQSFGKLGALFAATPLAWMLAGFGRRDSMVIIACVGALIAISLFVFIKNKPADCNVVTLAELKGKGAPEGGEVKESLFKGMLKLMYQPQVWLLIIATLGINSTINTIIQNWGPTLMKKGLNIDVLTASYVITVSTACMILGSSCLGFASKKLGLKKAWSISYILQGAVVLAMALFLPNMSIGVLYVLYAIVGLGSTYGIGATFAVARNMATPKFFATFIGLSNLICFFVGSAGATNAWALFLDNKYSIGGFQNACWFQFAILVVSFVAFILVKDEPIKAFQNQGKL